jgi:SAM-dependent methyltransferase
MTASDSAFDEAQRASAYPPGIGEHFWLDARNRILHRRIAGVAAGKAVLDLGCGPGVTVSYLRRRGIDCHGCDLAPYQPAEPALAGVLWLGQDVFTLPRETRARFQVLLLLDVLEHLAEPKPFLSRCLAELPALEHVLIMVPARQELFGGYDTYYGHYRRYDLASAAALCAPPALEVRGSGYFFHALYPTMAVQKLIDRERSVVFPRSVWRPWHRFLATVFQLEERIVPGGVPGSSLWLLARVRR